MRLPGLPPHGTGEHEDVRLRIESRVTSEMEYRAEMRAKFSE